MTTLIKEENGILIAEFKGRLDTAAAIQTTKDVEPLMVAENAKANGGQVTVKNINEEISKVFQMTGFNKLFTIL